MYPGAHAQSMPDKAAAIHYMAPRSIDFIDELPRLPTGKLYKRLLRDQYWSNKTTQIV